MFFRSAEGSVPELRDLRARIGAMPNGLNQADAGNLIQQVRHFEEQVRWKRFREDVALEATS